QVAQGWHLFAAQDRADRAGRQVQQPGQSDRAGEVLDPGSSEVAKQAGVSRQTVYKWVRRF
ncbi:MAG: helix-turn-helix domain-containing protein, partial [Pseudorhodobacter sp.]|nr:helix-turn-helix domain-containing protein [Frankiaceae bacterium]